MKSRSRLSFQPTDASWATRRPLSELEEPARQESRQSPARDRARRLLLPLADLVSTSLAAAVAIDLLGFNDRLLPTAVLGLPVVLLSNKAIGLYDRDPLLIRKTTLDEAPKLFQLATLYTLLFWLTHAVWIQGDIDRDQVLGFWGILFSAMLVGRAGARRLQRSVSRGERCLVLGEPADVARFAKVLKAAEGTDVKLVGWVPTTDGVGEEHQGAIPVLGSRA